MSVARAASSTNAAATIVLSFAVSYGSETFGLYFSGLGGSIRFLFEGALTPPSRFAHER